MKFQYELEDINHDYIILWCNLAKKQLPYFLSSSRLEASFDIIKFQGAMYVDPITNLLNFIAQ
jgi:hypothetical protein